jgi:glycosyltransferase involved in cell wall biosynthesis
MGARLGALRDPFNNYLLNAPDAFITLSHEAASQFRSRGTRVPVEVVYNGIEIKRCGGDRAEARGLFGLPGEGAIVALCGRLEVKQKGQLLLLAALHASAWLRSQVLTLIVGDGPDEGLLRERVRELGLQECVRFTGWCDTAALYPALDAVVIASRFEGMPLVMLESLASGVPVVSCDRDGMREILPSDWLYSPGDAYALAERLEWVLQNDVSQDRECLRERIRREMSVEVFQEHFVRTVMRYCGKGQSTRTQE